MKYILVLLDDFSGYKWLCPTSAANAEHAAKCIAKWIEVFTVMDVWVSDQGSHFKNSVMDILAESYGIRHHFTLTYSAWTNGTVERVNREVLRATRALMSEYRLAPKDWPDCVRIVQKTLDESPLERLGKSLDGATRSPLQVMTGIKPNSKILASSDDERFEGLSLEKARQLISVEELQASLDEMHNSSKDKIDKNRAKQIDRLNKRAHIIQPNFSVGDFVSVRTIKNGGHKLSLKWQGPRRITAVVNALVFEVCDLESSAKENVHACRLHFYKHGKEDQEIDPALISHARHTHAHYESIASLFDIKKSNGEFHIRVEWEGLPDDIDFTWEPLVNLYEDAPEMVLEYLQGSKKKMCKDALRTVQDDA